MQKEYKRVRIFNNNFLEKFSLVNWYTPFIFWIPASLFLFINNIRMYNLLPREYFVIFILGVLTWTLAEYLIHRYLFHYRCRSKLGKKIVYIMHGNHHEDPGDPLRGVMPIIPAAFYLSILYGMFYLIIPIECLDAFFSSFIIGYLMYDGAHFYTHHAKPKTRVGKYLRKMHLIHHVRDDIIFGISSPLWDYLFGTISKREQNKVLDNY